jgi:ABC-2 type transport system permease protein
MNTYLWLVRREFWERRSIWIVPAVIAGLVILVSLFGKTQFFVLDSKTQIRELGAAHLAGMGVLFFSVMSLCVTLYYLDCLYDDRRDRSILFWKSLPVSDTATVLSKLVMGMLVFPLLYYVLAEFTALITAFIVSVRAHTMVGGALWQGDLWLKIQVVWLWLIVSSAIWYLPVAGWLLVVSAAVKRAPMLWSVLPFLVVYLLERYFLGTHYFASLLGQRLAGYPAAAFHVSANPDIDDITQSVLRLIDVQGFFSSRETWIGLAVGVALIVGTIQVRMRRSEV